MLSTTILLACYVASLAAAVTFTVPAKSGSSGYTYTTLDPAPIGISFEFFTYPSYFTNVTATTQCLANWQNLTKVAPPIRIGGTTQDRALYDASSSAYVTYTVADPTDAPASLTYGPSFMSLAGTYAGSVVVGLNRGKNMIQNTISAAQVAVSRVTNLLAIELGNEPDYYKNDGQPIAAGTWNPATDAASQDDWDIRVGSALSKTPIIQAGNFNEPPATWGAVELINTENATVKQYVKTYAHHNYPGVGGTVQTLMNHANIVSDMHKFDADIKAALAQGKPYVLGETNSVSGGGAATVSPTFGAALWTMDYSLRAVTSQISRVYFHHGTIGACQYCFWGRYSMGAPYYGATAAVAFLAGAKTIAALDTGTANTYAGYVVFDTAGAPLRVLLYNSDYFNGTGTRTKQSFVLNGLPSGLTSVKSKKLTAASALSRQDRGSLPTWAGQTYTDGTCVAAGTETFDTTLVSAGQATFNLQASEAWVVYLQ